jgi:hypothetical protein
MILSTTNFISKQFIQRGVNPHFLNRKGTRMIHMMRNIQNKNTMFLPVLAMAVTLTTVTAVTTCSAKNIPKGADVVMYSPHKEKATGILFPQLCNGMQYVGSGVRVKYGFVKVYAVGTYVDPTAMAAIKNSGEPEISKALLNPMYPRTIRIVMNRGLSIEKYNAAIVEALEPRMKGQDLEKLEEFKMLNPAVDLVEGAEIEMTVRGNVLLYKNALGGVGQIDSQVFCEALCDLYYGDDSVSPGHRESVIAGIQHL